MRKRKEVKSLVSNLHVKKRKQKKKTDDEQQQKSKKECEAITVEV